MQNAIWPLGGDNHPSIYYELPTRQLTKHNGEYCPRNHVHLLHVAEKDEESPATCPLSFVREIMKETLLEEGPRPDPICQPD